MTVPPFPVSKDTLAANVLLLLPVGSRAKGNLGRVHADVIMRPFRFRRVAFPNPRGSSGARWGKRHGLRYGRFCDVCSASTYGTDLSGSRQALPQANLYSGHLWKRLIEIRSTGAFNEGQVRLRHGRDISLPRETGNNTA